MTHKPRDAQFVWFDHKGAGRNLYALFRRSFDLDAAPKAAVINLFADSHYQLFVNGVFVEFGPARFDPRFPQYDTIDITRHLKRGANAIAVLVNSFQHKVYKAISHCAGFVAWGTVESAGGGAVELATAPRTWRCIRDMARTRYAGKFSFALSAAELYDQAGELPGWNGASFDDSAWPFAVPLDDQCAWGPLEPRSIPFMSGAGVAIPKVKHVLPLATDEDLFSFSLPCPHHLEDDKAQWSGFVAFTSWIYSPGDQEVVAGTFWGDSWINGERVPRGVESVEHPMRINQHWQLKTGWNHFFGMVGAYQDVVEMYFALPRGKGIFFAADKCGKPAVSFKHSRILSMADYERHLKNKPMPYAPDDDLAEAGGWIAVDASTPAQSPSREMSWDVYGDAVEQLSVDGLRGHVF
ncbi:hypothetical protein GX586_15155, partial [bacterium]|nr:hypothetical protein [bacterium]